jgi:hypothetical protein
LAGTSRGTTRQTKENQTGKGREKTLQRPLAVGNVDEPERQNRNHAATVNHEFIFRESPANMIWMLAIGSPEQGQRLQIQGTPGGSGLLRDGVIEVGLEMKKSGCKGEKFSVTGDWRGTTGAEEGEGIDEAGQEDVEVRQQIIGKAFYSRGIPELGHCFSPLGNFLSGGLTGGIKSHHLVQESSDIPG